MDLEKKWFVIIYQLTHELKLINNLQNQNFHFYIPKILVSKNNRIKNSPLFPGYGFVQCSDNQLSSLKYTKGVKDVLKFGNSYACVDMKIINDIKKFSLDYEINSLLIKPELNSDVTILSGPLKGNLVRVMSLTKDDRVKFLYTLLGRNKISETDLTSIKIT